MSRGLAAPGMPGRAAALPPRAADAAGDAVAISKQPPRSFAQYISASAWRTRSSRTEFFFSSTRRHTMFSRDWSADVCSSDLIAELSNLGVSAATIRNELAALEDDGYVVQPHTSAGRVPTASAYRYYVDHLGPSRLRSATQAKIASFFDSVQLELTKLLKATSRLLADVTQL